MNGSIHALGARAPTEHIRTIPVTGDCASLLTDSNRPPPPYHRGLGGKQGHAQAIATTESPQTEGSPENE
jgi:hypothetical protein